MATETLQALPQESEKSQARRDELVKAAARDSLLRFVRLFDLTYNPSAFHRFLARKLTEIAQGKCRRLIVTVPPRHGKSRMVSIELPAWMLGHNPALEIILTGYSESLCSEFSVAARERLREPAYHAVFPETELSPWQQTKTEWTTTRGGKFRAVGVGGSITGKGGDLILIDDPVRDYLEAHSEVTREGVWNWFISTIYTRLSPNGAIVIVTTRRHLDGRSMSAGSAI